MTYNPGAWHDCHLWGIEFRHGEPALGDWTSDLVLRIDHIVEWLCGADGRASFRVAPTALTFRQVSDLAIDMRWAIPNAMVQVHEAAIDTITRTAVPGTAEFDWVIMFNWPAGSTIRFRASGYTQVPLGATLLVSEQRLTRAERALAMARSGTGYGA